MTRIFILSLIAGFIGMVLANSKGRSPFGWFILCFLFPLCAAILLFLPALGTSSMRKCPDCGDTIAGDSSICKSCNKELPIDMVTCHSCGVVVRNGNVCENCGKSM